MLTTTHEDRIEGPKLNNITGKNQLLLDVISAVYYGFIQDFLLEGDN